MERFDCAVIGAGLLGAFCARGLARYALDVVMLEAEEDVCLGLSRANSAIVYSGCDNKPGSLKAQLTVEANLQFDMLCRALDVPFKRTGSLMTATGPQGLAVLRKKQAQATANGLGGVRLLSGDEARHLEPLLADNVQAALYVPQTGVVEPWQLAIAAFENACANGACAQLNTRVTAIRCEGTGYVIETTRGAVFARAIVNAAGLSAPQVQALCYPCAVALRLDAADYFVLDRRAPSPAHVIFQEGEDGKGVTAVPTIQGTLLLESPPRPLGRTPHATTKEGLARLEALSSALLLGFDRAQIIRRFAAVRPNPVLVTDAGARLHDFVILAPAENFISLVGIKTPGLTAAERLGAHVAERLAAVLGAQPNTHFNPHRPGIHQEGGRILCQCEGIPEDAVREAIRRGALTPEGVKHRLGSGMGPCQGSRCQRRIAQLIEEVRHDTH